jgi:hypothetical protein
LKSVGFSKCPRLTKSSAYFTSGGKPDIIAIGFIITMLLIETDWILIEIVKERRICACVIGVMDIGYDGDLDCVAAIHSLGSLVEIECRHQPNSQDGPLHGFIH